ncbi:MAG TPA: DUF5655 domain-containing protein [Streptosporangiaceae bacterium]|jgi:hypothetical protein
MWTVEAHMEGKPSASIALYEAFVAAVTDCGPFNVAVSKTSITFKGSRRGFAGARPTAGGVRGYLDLQRAVTGPQITSATPYTSRLYVHHFRLASEADLDPQFRSWIAEAYAVGAGAHMRP